MTVNAFFGCVDMITDRRWLARLRRALAHCHHTYASDAGATLPEKARALRKADVILLPVTAAAASHESELAFYEGAAIGLGTPVVRIAPSAVSEAVPRWLQRYVVLPKEKMSAFPAVLELARRGKRSNDRNVAVRTSHVLHAELQAIVSGADVGVSSRKHQVIKAATHSYKLDEAFGLLKQITYANFNETVELSMLLGVDPTHADQMVRGTTVLPHGTGNAKRVVVIASEEKQKEAADAGADFVGGEELIEKIRNGWTDFDAVIATPDMMRSVGTLGKVLGPRGLMPNPKTGTATFDVATAIQEIKAGKVQFRVDKTSIIHVPVGKISFSASQLRDNAAAVINAVRKAKPRAAKGKYVRTIYISSRMSPSIPVTLDPISATLDLGTLAESRKKGIA